MKDLNDICLVIKDIKKHRESTKLFEMANKKSSLQLAEENCVLLQDKLKGYAANRLLEQDKVYGEVIGKSNIFLKDLDKVFYKIKRMKATEEDLNIQVVSAEQEKANKEKEYEQAKKEYKVANANVVKMEELSSFFSSQLELEEENKEISELDDIAQASFYLFKRRVIK